MRDRVSHPPPPRNHFTRGTRHDASRGNPLSSRPCLLAGVDQLLPLLIHHPPTMSSTPSSRRRGHSSRNSQSSTPAQQAQATPRSSRRAPSGSAAAVSSSPLFLQSSPARGTPAPPSQLASDGMIISSPPRQPSNAGDREATPRASTRPVAGENPPLQGNHQTTLT